MIALHLRRAGDHLEAAEHYRLAAEHAASLHANADALEYLEAALGLGHPDAAGIHERIGDLRTLRGDYGGALASFESAAAQGSRPRPSPQSSTRWARCITDAASGSARRRASLAALDATPAGELALRARIKADLGLALHHAGHPERATALAREALELAEAAGDDRAQAQAHNMLGVLARHAGELDGALDELERSVALAEELGDEPAQAAALNNLALVHAGRRASWRWRWS